MVCSGWQESVLSHGDNEGQRRERAVDDRAGGWKKNWAGNDGATVTVAVAAVATADVAGAVVATETAMSRRRRRCHPNEVSFSTSHYRAVLKG